MIIYRVACVQMKPLLIKVFAHHPLVHFVAYLYICYISVYRYETLLHSHHSNSGVQSYGVVDGDALDAHCC